MKKNHFFSFLLFFSTLIFCERTKAQAIRNDTIIVTTDAEVTIIFPSKPGGRFVEEGDFFYEINDGGKKALVIKAKKKGAKDQRITITEDSRVHEFVLTYRDEVPTMLIDKWAKRKDLKNYVDKKDKTADKRLDAANQLYDQRRFEDALVEYKWLVWEVNKSKEVFVRNRISETETAIRETKENKYKEAMAKGEKFVAEKKYKEAIMAFDDAIAAMPDDSGAQTRRSSTNKLLFESYKKKAEEAVALKNYIEAEFNYAEAKNVDPILFVPNEKSYGNVVTKANTQREENEKKRKYYTTLANAKVLATKAVTAEDYDIAIKEYKTASSLFKDNKFPKDKINILTKMKKDLSAKIK